MCHVIDLLYLDAVVAPSGDSQLYTLRSNSAHTPLILPHTPSYSAHTPLILPHTPLILRSHFAHTPSYSAHTPLILPHTPLTLRSYSLILRSYSLILSYSALVGYFLQWFSFAVSKFLLVHY